jgi:hypothetical protein
MRGGRKRKIRLRVDGEVGQDMEGWRRGQSDMNDKSAPMKRK